VTAVTRTADLTTMCSRVISPATEGDSAVNYVMKWGQTASGLPLRGAPKTVRSRGYSTAKIAGVPSEIT
jgi:hypothetical protein